MFFLIDVLHVMMVVVQVKVLWIIVKSLVLLNFYLNHVIQYINISLTKKTLFFLLNFVQIADRTSLTGYPTLLAHHLSIELLYPTHVFHSLIPTINQNEFNLFSKPSLFPSDYHLVNLRTLNNNHDDTKYSASKTLALIIRRFAYDCDETYDKSFHFEQVRYLFLNSNKNYSFPFVFFQPIFEHFFQTSQIESIEQTSLSLRYIKHQLNITSKLDLPFAEIVTYKIRFNQYFLFFSF